MKDETKKNIKETFEDIAMVIVCLVLVMSLNHKCTNAITKTTRNEIKKAQELKNKTNSYVQTQQKTR